MPLVGRFDRPCQPSCLKQLKHHLTKHFQMAIPRVLAQVSVRFSGLWLRALFRLERKRLGALIVSEIMMQP